MFSADAFQFLEISQVISQRCTENVPVAPSLGSVSWLMHSYKSFVLPWRSGIELNFNTGMAFSVVLFIMNHCNTIASSEEMNT